MRRTRVVILILLTLGLSLQDSAHCSEITALKIRGKLFEPQSQELSYELWNESDKTITAWRLSLARSDPHGHAQKSILDQDFFDIDGSGSRAQSGPLAPGRSAPGKWRLDIGEEEPGIRALSLIVVAVVFEDSSWQGEPRAAEAILEAREARVEEIGRVLSSLESDKRGLRSREDWTATLRQQSRLLRQQGVDREQLAGGRRESAAQISATRLELAQWLEDASHEVSLAPDPEQTMGHLTGILRKRYSTGMKAVQLRAARDASANRGNGGDR